MDNARNEFRRFWRVVCEKRPIRCAIVRPYADCCFSVADKTMKGRSIVLREGYTRKDFQNFLRRLDFQYDDGYGTQELDGEIWFTDGTWATREEYDGSEWWEFHRVPPIPPECSADARDTWDDPIDPKYDQTELDQTWFDSPHLTAISPHSATIDTLWWEFREKVFENNEAYLALDSVELQFGDVRIYFQELQDDRDGFPYVHVVTRWENMEGSYKFVDITCETLTKAHMAYIVDQVMNEFTH